MHFRPPNNAYVFGTLEADYAPCEYMHIFSPKSYPQETSASWLSSTVKGFSYVLFKGCSDSLSLALGTLSLLIYVDSSETTLLLCACKHNGETENTCGLPKSSGSLYGFFLSTQSPSHRTWACDTPDSNTGPCHHEVGE